MMESTRDVDVKSIVYLVFTSVRKTERLLWQHWYNMQANPNQRAFDIDGKNCENAENIEDLGHNAFSVQWSPSKGPAKLVFCVNCLSMDFSAQNGVAGIPLHLLVDTYEDFDPSADPVHRAICKIKVFHDKGADRKIKDEMRSVKRQLQKMNPKGRSPSGSNDFQPPSKVTTLTPTSTLGPFPFIFIPAPHGDSLSKASSSKLATSSLLQNIRERETKRRLSTPLIQAKDEFDNLDVNPPNKKVAMSRDDSEDDSSDNEEDLMRAYLENISDISSDDIDDLEQYKRKLLDLSDESKGEKDDGWDEDDFLQYSDLSDESKGEKDDGWDEDDFLQYSDLSDESKGEKDDGWDEDDLLQYSDLGDESIGEKDDGWDEEEDDISFWFSGDQGGNLQ
ncbi:grainyhead-like protein 2 homolog isoform X2 [Dysidea avara]|uniref:grainyhead-like protein 2 homolog isoform X2 n=1 Tax=Dysidea avara TaxID=196820 RepID=UPI0033344277